VEIHLELLNLEPLDRLERLEQVERTDLRDERSEAVEPFDKTQGRLLERLERTVGFRGITHSARGKEGIRKIHRNVCASWHLPANGRLGA